MASPMARLLMKKAGGSDHGCSRINRHSLRNGFTAYTRPPRCPGLIATVACRSSPAGLIPASGDQDHATSPSASATFVLRAIRVHRIPAPRVVTIGRKVPLHRGGMRETLLVICPTRQAWAPAADWHDGQIVHGVYAGFTRRVAAATLPCPGAYRRFATFTCCREFLLPALPTSESNLRRDHRRRP
jgi:hypothetical protein